VALRKKLISRLVEGTVGEPGSIGAEFRSRLADRLEKLDRDIVQNRKTPKHIGRTSDPFADLTALHLVGLLEYLVLRRLDAEAVIFGDGGDERLRVAAASLGVLRRPPIELDYSTLTAERLREAQDLKAAKKSVEEGGLIEAARATEADVSELLKALREAWKNRNQLRGRDQRSPLSDVAAEVLWHLTLVSSPATASRRVERAQRTWRSGRSKNE
jgi:hypothetical protein